MGTSGEPLDLESLRIVAMMREPAEERNDPYLDDYGHED